MSMREKLAWARQRGVRPPNYVLVAATEEAAEDEPGSFGEQPQRQDAACCSAQQSGSCCSQSERMTCSECSHEHAAADKGIEWVIGIQAQKCQGLALLWITTGAIAPPPAPVALPTDSNPPVWYPLALPVFWPTISEPPDVPPPRLS